MNKPPGVPKSYCFIYLHRVFFKIFERLTLVCVKPIVDLLLPTEQAGFTRKISNLDLIILLKQDIEHNFMTKGKAGAVFVGLKATYRRVWHCSLDYKQCCLLPQHANGANDYGTPPQYELHPQQQKQITLQMMMLKNDVHQKLVLDNKISTNNLPSTKNMYTLMTW